MVKKNKKAPVNRKRKTPQYKSFRLSKKIKPSQKKPIPGIYNLTKSTFSLLANNKKLFFGIVGVHLVLSIIFSGMLSSTFNFVSTKQDLEEAFAGQASKISTTTLLLGDVISASGSTAGGYQIFFTLVTSLALIWAIRQVLAGEKIGIRQAYYQGAYPIIPFILVLCVIGLQLMPFIIGNFLLTTIISNGLAVTAMEQILWWLIFLLFALLSFYLITSSTFGLYISTLPDMTPMRALRSARDLVLHRRVSIALRLLGLPVLAIIFYIAILVPLIIFLPLLAVPGYIGLVSFSLFFIHGYIYSLYRSLL